MAKFRKIRMTFEEYDYIFSRMKEECEKNKIALILPNTMEEFILWRDSVLPQMMSDDNPKQVILWMCVLADCGRFKNDAHLSETQQKLRRNEHILIKKKMHQIINECLEIQYSN